MGLVVGLVIAAVLVPTVWFADFGVRKVLGYLGYYRSLHNSRAEEAYLAKLESGEIIAPKVTVTAISLVTRTTGVIKLYQITNSGLKELNERTHCFEGKGVYSAWWESLSLSDSAFKGSAKYKFVGVLGNGKRVQFCLHERYGDSGKSYTISSSKGLGADRIDFKISNLTPNATYLLGQIKHKADESGCITTYYYRRNSYEWISSESHHLSRVDNYDFTDILDIKFSLWNP